jgi:hypothetical protein
MNLKHTHGRVVVEVDLEKKNHHTFEHGETIRLERNFNNFNQREVMPVNAIVISAENIPTGAEVLIAHNCTHEVNRIYDYKNLSGEDQATDIKYFSIQETDCFLWRMNDGDWQPIGIYATALRVFKPYLGFLEGIEPEIVENVLYVTSGEYKGLVVRTLKACDYQIVFQESNGRESNIIRFRPNGDEEEKREPEAIAIEHDLTEKVANGELFIGLTIKDCQPLIQAYAE